MRAERLERMTMAERHETLTRGLSRRAFLGAAALTAGPILLTSGATAETPRTPIGGRWLAMGADPARQMRVSWQVPAAVSGPLVRFGADAGYGHVAHAELTALRTRLPGGRVVEQYYAHANLDGLSPGRAYHYRIEHKGVQDGGGTFNTAPASTPRTPFTFTAFGDQGVTANSVRGNAAVLAQRPAFHLLAGDMSYADATGRGSATDDYRPAKWDLYFNEISKVAATVPWMVTTGNHEMEALYPDHGYGGLTRRFALPGNGPAGCPGAYTFRYQNVGVVSLDANDVTYELAANRGYTMGAQTAWLKSTLTKMRADPAVDFIVVFFHQCPYATCTAHGSDGGIRAAWTGLFDAHEVDLVINGHNHAYERTDPIRAGRAVKAAPRGATLWPHTDGTTYVVAGGGGVDVNHFRTGTGSTVWREPGISEKEQAAWSRTRYAGYTLLSVRVTPGATRSTMTVRALRPGGEEVDHVTLARARPEPQQNRSQTVLANRSPEVGRDHGSPRRWSDGPPPHPRRRAAPVA